MRFDVSARRPGQNNGFSTVWKMDDVKLFRRGLIMKYIYSRFSTSWVVLAIVLTVPGAIRAQNAAATYKAKCAGCHGADGKANTAPAKALGVHDFASAEVARRGHPSRTKPPTPDK